MNRFLAIICLLSLTVGSISGATRYKGDLNNDGKVNLADMAVLANAINEGKTDKTLHDVNASGNVDDNDLHALANIILSEKLTEDTGLNVGIGGWEDGGEDFGGSVGASTRGTRGMDDVRLYIEGPKSDLDKSLTYVDFGIEPSSEGVSAILFNIQVPNDVVFESGKYAMLYNELFPGHAIYGTPVIKQDSEWEKRLRFIVFSPKLNAIEESAPLGRLVYSTLNETGGNSVSFKNCQVISKGSATIEEMPEHGSWINSWTPKLISSLSIEQGESLETYPGEYIWLSRVIDPVDASYTKLKWTSSNPEIVSIDSSDDYQANCTPHIPGEAVITVSALDGSGCHASIRFIVKDPIIPVSYISVSSDVMEVLTGNSLTLTELYTVNPDNATDKRVEYSVSDAAIATVEGDNITFNKSGEVTLTISALDGSGCKASVKFVVKDIVIPVSSISVSSDVMEVLTGSAMPLTELYTVNPENATDKRVEYSVSDADIATVEGDNVIFNKSGEVTLTISALDGSGCQAQIHFIVKDPVIPVSFISVNNYRMDVLTGNVMTLTELYTVNPDNATDKRVEYSVSDAAIATVEGDNVIFNKSGEVTLTISALDGSGCQAQIHFIVKDVVIPVSSISVSSDVIEVFIGDVLFLPEFYTINPDNATEKTTQYSVSNDGIASLDGDNITFHKSGEMFLTIYALDTSGCQATIKFIVKDVVIPVSSISVSSEVMEVLTGNTISLTELYTVNPDNATDKRVEYYVSDAAIATVEGDNITFNKSGEVTLTISALDGSGCNASIKFVVKDVVIPVTAISVSSDVMEVLTGNVMTLTELYTVNPENATDKRVEYYVSDAAIATVEGDNITFNKSGEATLTISALDGSGCQASIKFVVKDVVIPVTAISVSSDVMEVLTGNTISLTELYTVNPENATDKRVEYSVSDASIAIVEGDNITFNKSGEVTLTISALDGSGCQTQIHFIVKDVVVPVSSISVSSDVMEVLTGNVMTLTELYTVNPDNATDKRVEYSVSDADIATVEGDNITFKRSGEVTLTISALDGSGCQAQIHFIVKDVAVPVSSISVSSDVMEVLTGNTISLTELYTVNPENATDKRVEYYVSDAAIATVEGDNITFNKSGEVTLTISTLDGSGSQAQIHFIVKDVVVPVSSISVSSDVMEVLTGNTISLTELYTVNPENATDKRVEYSVSDAAIATVEGDNVIFNKSGEVILTISALDGSGCQASIRFIVKDPVIPVLSLDIINADTGELIPADGFSLEVGNGIHLGVKFTPENTTDKRVEWSSSDETVATVTQDGYLEIRGEGNAQIKAKSLDGSGIEATFQILGKSGIDSIFNDPDVKADVYNLRGILVISQASASDIETLPKGTYILHTPRTTVKIRK